MADQDGQEALLPAWWVGTVDRLPAGLAYCSCKPATGPSGRAARGSVYPRKVACRSVAVNSDCGSRPSTRARGAAWLLPLNSARRREHSAKRLGKIALAVAILWSVRGTSWQ